MIASRYNGGSRSNKVRQAVLFVFLAGFAVAQTAPPPAFEVASVKINESFLGHDNRWEGSVEVTPGSLAMRKVTWFGMLEFAYGTASPQIAGPSWFELESYDVIAKAGRPADKDEMRRMLQTLLADRFKLAFHRETRELSGLALVEAKGGHKMKRVDPKESAEPAAGIVRSGMAELAKHIGFELRIPVVDMTRIDGLYDFAYHIRPYYDEARKMEPFNPVNAHQLFLQKELGLRLESRKTPLEVLVVDHVEKTPVAN
jgi:uncharacterized protein (TIGR03435 family)